MNDTGDYRLLLKFIDTYLPMGFEGIQKDDPLMLQINAMMENNNQYFYIADMLELKVLFTCQTITKVLGINAEGFNPGWQFKGTHPDDIQRHSITRGRMFQLCCDLYIEDKDKHAIMSTSLRFRHLKGHYINMLTQGFVFTSRLPIPTTYALFVNTDISWFGPIKHGYNHYIGDDMSYFRLPDEDLILTGSIFTDREFEIVKLIRDGKESHDIAEILFISTHTVDTHRRNILKKTGHHNISELIIDLQERGFF